MSRAAWLASFHLRSGALRTRLFPPSKWAGLFPSAAYRRSAPPQLALGRLKEMQVGMFRQRLGGFAAPKSELLFFFNNWHCTYSTNGAGMIRCCLDIFATQKASVISYPRWPFMRAMRPVAEWRPFLFNWRFTTPNPRGPLPSGGNSAANPHIPRVLRALRARCGVQGVTPCCEP